MYTLLAQAPRFALAAVVAVYCYTGHEWVALFPLAVFIYGPGCPKVR